MAADISHSYSGSSDNTVYQNRDDVSMPFNPSNLNENEATKSSSNKNLISVSDNTIRTRQNEINTLKSNKNDDHTDRFGLVKEEKKDKKKKSRRKNTIRQNDEETHLEHEEKETNKKTTNRPKTMMKQHEEEEDNHNNKNKNTTTTTTTTSRHTEENDTHEQMNKKNKHTNRQENINREKIMNRQENAIRYNDRDDNHQDKDMEKGKEMEKDNYMEQGKDMEKGNDMEQGNDMEKGNDMEQGKDTEDKNMENTNTHSIRQTKRNTFVPNYCINSVPDTIHYKEICDRETQNQRIYARNKRVHNSRDNVVQIDPANNQFHSHDLSLMTYTATAATTAATTATATMDKTNQRQSMHEMATATTSITMDQADHTQCDGHSETSRNMHDTYCWPESTQEENHVSVDPASSTPTQNDRMRHFTDHTDEDLSTESTEIYAAPDVSGISSVSITPSPAPSRHCSRVDVYDTDQSESFYADESLGSNFITPALIESNNRQRIAAQFSHSVSASNASNEERMHSHEQITAEIHDDFDGSSTDISDDHDTSDFNATRIYARSHMHSIRGATTTNNRTRLHRNPITDEMMHPHIGYTTRDNNNHTSRISAGSSAASAGVYDENEHFYSLRNHVSRWPPEESKLSAHEIDTDENIRIIWPHREFTRRATVIDADSASASQQSSESDNQDKDWEQVSSPNLSSNVSLQHVDALISDNVSVESASIDGTQLSSVQDGRNSNHAVHLGQTSSISSHPTIICARQPESEMELDSGSRQNVQSTSERFPSLTHWGFYTTNPLYVTTSPASATEITERTEHEKRLSPQHRLSAIAALWTVSSQSVRCEALQVILSQLAGIDPNADEVGMRLLTSPAFHNSTSVVDNAVDIHIDDIESLYRIELPSNWLEMFLQTSNQQQLQILLNGIAECSQQELQMIVACVLAGLKTS